MADVVIGAGRRGRHRARAGLPLLAARADAGRARGPTCARCTSCTRRSPTRHARRAARRRGRRAARRHGRLRACGFHCHQWEAGLPACYAGGSGPGGAAAPSWPRSAPTPTCSAHEAASPDVRGGGGGAAGRGRRPPHHRPVRPHGALEEHRAGHAGLRGAAARPPRVARRGGARGAGLPVAAGAGRVSRLRRRRRAHGRADQPRLGHGRRWTPILLSRRGRPGPLAGRARPLSDVLLVNPVRDGLNLVAKEGPLLNDVRRGARALARGRRLGGAALAAAGRSASTPSTSPARPTPCTGADDGPAERARRAGALRAAVRARTAADWWADQLAAAAAAAPAQD